MARELHGIALMSQLANFEAYALRGGRLSFEEWMAEQRFGPEDRATLRAVWTRQQREAV